MRWWWVCVVLVLAGCGKVSEVREPDLVVPSRGTPSARDVPDTQARGVQRFFGPCPSWQVTQAELCGLPPVARTTDHYAFIVYALPDKEIAVPAYDPAVNPNYVDTLNAFFDSIDLGTTEIHVPCGSAR